MRIADSSVNLASSRTALQKDVERESLRMWRDGEGERRLEANGNTGLKDNTGLQELALSNSRRLERSSPAPSISISEKARALQPQRTEIGSAEATDLSSEEEFEFLLLKTLVEFFTQKKIELFKPVDAAKAQSLDIADPNDVDGNARQGWGVSYDYYASHYESETTHFTAQALVRTADGKEISVDLELNMSREFETSEFIRIRAGDARLKDPLVINFNGNAAQLTQTKFAFDIDADGRKDQISFVTGNSGFLALDKNSNNKIDDGSELFGALSGAGFSDLAAYDQDHNQWIDENDSIYQQLRIWTRDSDGNDRLLALGDADVGAIYLGHVESEFKLVDSENQQLGQIRDTGLYLKDSGGVGSVQQIDLVV